VSLTLPCVAGPYTTISCTLRLLKNSIRINTTTARTAIPNTDDEGLPADDVRFVERQHPVKAIAASSGQNDSGVFELSFRDERYLPFEGAGAISEWSLELFSDLPANNPDPLSRTSAARCASSTMARSPMPSCTSGSPHGKMPAYSRMVRSHTFESI